MFLNQNKRLLNSMFRKFLICPCVQAESAVWQWTQGQRAPTKTTFISLAAKSIIVELFLSRTSVCDYFLSFFLGFGVCFRVLFRFFFFFTYCRHLPLRKVALKWGCKWSFSSRKNLCFAEITICSSAACKSLQVSKLIEKTEPFVRFKADDAIL